MEKIKQKTEMAEVDDDVADLQAKVKGLISKLDPVAKSKMKSALKEKGLPTAIGKVTDASVLNQILEVISQWLNKGGTKFLPFIKLNYKKYLTAQNYSDTIQPEMRGESAWVLQLQGHVKNAKRK